MGEAMLEMSHPDGTTTRLAFGCDTLNTALYLARLGHAPHYVTALGTDPHSQGLIREWERECIQTLQMLRHPTRMPGIYAVQTDHLGERSFDYWRDTSAARAFSELGGAMDAIAFAAEADWLYLSGITLSIFTLAEGHKTGAEHATRWLDEGARAVILKCGPQGEIIYDNDDEPRQVPEAVEPIDTTGAGDSFSAACLSGLIRGLSLEQAADRENRLAARVIRHHGAIIPLEAMPGLFIP
jgi:sugar/nucleoside kinase (ribokinase family)